MQNWAEMEFDQRLADEITERLQLAAENANADSVGSETCRDRSGYRRFLCDLRVGRELADSFINSRSGYRGHYYDHPEFGEEFNNRVVSLLSRRLEALYGATRDTLDESKRLTNAELRISIAGGKLWVKRQKHNGQFVCQRWIPDNWPHNVDAFQRDLANEVGLEAARTFVAEHVAPREEKLKAFAPYRLINDLIAIKGAFVRHHRIWTPPRKVHRSLELHHIGGS